jgi:hypothetical protein
MKKNTEIKPELISAYQFAERKGCKSQAVYVRMAKGDITFIFVGKTKYIDWKANEHVEFPHSEKIRANKEAAV